MSKTSGAYDMSVPEKCGSKRLKCCAHTVNVRAIILKGIGWVWGKWLA
jgi:hypothetical protein